MTNIHFHFNPLKNKQIIYHVGLYPPKGGERMEEKSMAPLTDYAVVHSALFLVDWSFDWWQMMMMMMM